MNIVLNFVPLKSGGGVQVGLDFIEQAKRLGTQHRWYLVCSAGTPFESVGETANFRCSEVVPRSAGARFWFEYVSCRALLRKVQADVVYTQFGPQWPAASDYRNVVGCAYSNLCYPEIDFWKGFPPLRRAERHVVDVLRRRRLYLADLVIFETEDLAERAIRILQLPPARVAVAKPAASVLVSPRRNHDETRRRCADMPRGFRVVLLSVYNPNKNMEVLPRVARILKDHHAIDDVVFVLTLPKGSAPAKSLAALADELGVGERIYNFGPVPHEGCAELYRVCDAVILPSQLESFSNTIGEAWVMRKPLLITDMDWARSICDDAALYFKYSDPADIARQIVRLRSADTAAQALTRAGESRLETFPTSERRFQRYLELIEATTAESM